MAPLTVFFVGAKGIGKTALMNTLTLTKSSDIGPTLGVEMRSWSFKADGRIKKFQLWDASGNNIYANLLLHDIQHADIVVICFDTRYEEDLIPLKHWMTVMEQSSTKKTIVLYGIIFDGEMRKVMPADIYRIADHAMKRRNLRDVLVAEGRLHDRGPIYNALFVASRHI
jgi:hypothetical protein